MLHVTVLALYLLLTGWVVSYVMIHRRWLDTMIGMMTSMSVGMISGLGIGSTTGLMLPGYFFQATVLSMLAGGLCGLISGLPLGMLAVLDGTLSGLMAGMMGTMLIIMVPPSFAHTTVLLLSIVGSAILFAVHLLLLQETHREQAGFIGKPGVLFSMIAAFQFLFFFQASSLNSTPLSAEHLHHHDSIIESDLADMGTDPSSNELLIKASEFAFTPNKIEVAVNDNVLVTLDNEGKVEHDLEVVGTGVHIHAEAGHKKSDNIRFSKPGTYRAVCTLPGHQEAGMVAIIHVKK
ncbi:cupredoxin domain-containing protein [Paenibacillus caui]|uniref:cupredoxin domain-containing protein n=1 Tax=Paenibacillus caui TaxID=2873927 RepID=UPI001CA90052|nr:cupredoxin domain-containing protein [Paenibacillus caui]